MNQETAGVVYTKPWVAGLMLDMAGYVEGSDRLLSQHLVVEPSCGDGVFLSEIIRRLIADSHPATKEEWAQLSDAVRAYDIDAQATASCRETSIRMLQDSGCPYDIAQDLADCWINNADFLLSRIPKADWVVGNPPYIRATDMDAAIRDRYMAVNDSMTAGTDIYVGFFDHGIDALKPDGRLCFICSDRWLQNQYGTRLREKVATEANFDTLVRMHGVDAFVEEVDAYPAITLITKSSPSSSLKYADCVTDFTDSDVSSLLAWLGSPSNIASARFSATVARKPQYPSDMFPLGAPDDMRFVMQAQERLPKLESTGVNLGIGIATGCDAVFITDDPNLVEKDRMLPLFYMRDHRRHIDKQRWLVNPWNPDGSLVDLDNYPIMKAYFNENRAKLTKRHIAKRNASAWYRTIDKLNPTLMHRDLLLMPDMAALPDPILSYGKYPHHNCYWISSDVWDLRVLGGLLMSEQTKTFIDCLGVKMRGRTLRFQAQYLRLLHVPRYRDITAKTRDALACAFDTDDRELATASARQAYLGGLS
ncbi:Eco57I restriction-modification methylase domain-containing protein [Bifidobacterium scaligerum]|uniref:site-specific DNA-methyltransferase (adenine-specific) n=1 Tax=Bifidobacterium scaligerum TaxID=2052656 RepID=A0A2M9HR46_9BIFI|nr:Eco57I restriction-modification methylase domain-containing protein [Bifidobacterium scaligerum]PJM79291.1 SAM-dependent methyltransferase [Bifidobacterium scaligerum]